MHKLVILIGQPENQALFEEKWPLFLQWAEEMPGLRREATSWISYKLAGPTDYTLMHELFFDDRAAVEKALKSVMGQKAGQTLHWITGGRVSLFLADHHEDALENIKQAQQKTSPEVEADDGTE